MDRKLSYSKNLAEFVGIMLGDGNLYVNENKGQYMIRVAFNKKDRKYMSYVSSLAQKLFDLTPKYYLIEKQNELMLYINNKKLVKKLIEIGLVVGNKKRNNVGIPRWVFSKNAYLKRCIRGLVDTDGCLYKKYNYPNILQIEFYSAIPNLSNDFRKGLKKLGFKVSKMIKRTGGASPKCGIYGKYEVKRYCEEIGFKNHKYNINTVKLTRPG